MKTKTKLSKVDIKKREGIFSTHVVRCRDKNNQFYYIDRNTGKRRTVESWKKSLDYRKDPHKYELSESDNEFFNLMIDRREEQGMDSSEEFTIYFYELNRLVNLYLFQIKNGRVNYSGPSITKKNSFEFLLKLKNDTTDFYKNLKKDESSFLKADIILTNKTLKIINIYS